MDFNVDIRHKQLESLHQFIDSSEEKVNTILKQLDWSLSEMSNEDMMNCKIQQTHRVPFLKLHAHVDACKLRQENYDEHEQFLSYPKPSSKETVYLDDNKKVEILSIACINNPKLKTKWQPTATEPRTSNRFICTFTPDERLVLYDYAVSATETPPQAPEYTLSAPSTSKGEDRKLSFLEMEALERDAKRRRMKYKTKSVHTGKKNYTEVMRDVIDNQMESYKDWIHDQGRAKKKLKSDK